MGLSERCSGSSGLFRLKSWAGIVFLFFFLQKGDEMENTTSVCRE